MGSPQQHKHPMVDFERLASFALRTVNEYQQDKRLVGFEDEIKLLYRSIGKAIEKKLSGEVSAEFVRQYVVLYELLEKKLRHIPENWRLASETRVHPNRLHKLINDFLKDEQEIYDEYKNQKKSYAMKR